jgi:hypothetical protein
MRVDGIRVAGAAAALVGILAGAAFISPAPAALREGSRSADATAGECGSERPRPLRNGPQAKRADSVVGQGPVVFGGFSGATATPALVNRDGQKVVSKFYFMSSRRGPERATITGWRRGRPGERLLFDDPRAEGYVRALTLRPSEFGAEQARLHPTWLYVYQPNGLIALRPGCYLVRVRWRGGVRTTVFDLTARAIVRRRPPSRP